MGKSSFFHRNIDYRHLNVYIFWHMRCEKHQVLQVDFHPSHILVGFSAVTFKISPLYQFTFIAEIIQTLVTAILIKVLFSFSSFLISCSWSVRYCHHCQRSGHIIQRICRAEALPSCHLSPSLPIFPRSVCT